MSSSRAHLIFGLAGLLASSGLAAAPLDVVAKCAAGASPTTKGIKALEAVCPDLQGALATLGFEDLLFEGWQQEISPHALEDVRGLVERYSRPRWHAPDAASLSQVLASMREPGPKTTSWWQSFKSWLKNWLSRSDSSLAGWLNRLLDRWSGHTDVSVTFLKIVAYCLSALVAIAAVVIIVREFKAAAGLGRRAKRSAQSNSSSEGAPAADLGVGRVPGSAADGLAVLLRALVSRLLQLGRLRADRSLTHRELVARSLFENEEQRAAFAGVAYGAEANFYGPRDGIPAVADEVKRRGEVLLAQLAEPKSTS